MKACKVVLFALAAVILIFGTVSNATAQGNWVENTRTEIDTDILVGCGLNEYWHLTGTNHILSREFWDEAGGFHVSYHYNIQNATAESPRGEIYRAVHSDRIQTVNFDCEAFEGDLICTGPVGGLPKEFTLTRHIRLIDPGPGGNIVFNLVVHLTVDANGPPPNVYFEKVDVKCDQ